MEDIVYERKINYYETDKMGVVHHSNYIRFLEEARCYWMDQVGAPFSYLEKKGITIPALSVSCSYKNHVTFDDVLQIRIYIKDFNGVRVTVGYDVRDKKNGKNVIVAETKHCFTNNQLKPINLKKYAPEVFDKFEQGYNIYNKL